MKRKFLTLLGLFLLLNFFVLSKRNLNYNQELVIQIDKNTNVDLLEKALRKLPKKHNERIVPYVTADELKKTKSKSLIQLSRYFLIETDSNDQEKEQLRKYLYSLPFITASYIKPSFKNAVFEIKRNYIYNNNNNNKQKYQKSNTPLFVERQIYRNKAPDGVNIDSVKHIPGSNGEGITVYDVEQGFNFEHEDLIEHDGRLLVGTPRESSSSHGAAVCGVISGFNNSFGITGITYASKIHGCSFHDSGSRHPRVGPTLVKCAAFIKPGDVMLLEMHAIGPNRRFIAMEWWPDNHLAIKAAIENGIIVVQAGGNGNENLDDEIYNRPQPGFPIDWVNPFNRSLVDSHSIIVGAGAPPPGTHGRNHGPDRSRLGFSNYGSAVDCQGWGREVTTIGYGDLQRISKNRLYTDTFSGTSSASPVVVGAIVSIQGILKKRGLRMDSKTARHILRITGSEQQDANGRPVSQRIGNRPDLFQMLKVIEYDEYVKKNLKKI